MNSVGRIERMSAAVGFVPVVAVVALTATACGASNKHASAASEPNPLSTRVAEATHSAQSNPAHAERRRDGAILVQDGAPYIFEPASSRDAEGVLDAQQAYMAMLPKNHHGPTRMPAKVSAAFGYLTEDDTSPPADRMPVWAFRVSGGCINTFKSTHAQCDQWTFVRASDGKNLGVMDQSTVS